jgi:hypothetical protein
MRMAPYPTHTRVPIQLRVRNQIQMTCTHNLNEGEGSAMISVGRREVRTHSRVPFALFVREESEARSRELVETSSEDSMKLMERRVGKTVQTARQV